MEQMQGMGGGEEGRRIRAETEALRGRCDFLEGAFTQMTNFVIDLKDKLDAVGGGTTAQVIPLGSFASRSEFDQPSLLHFEQTRFWVSFQRDSKKTCGVILLFEIHA